jgi:hypothetical protein
MGKDSSELKEDFSMKYIGKSPMAETKNPIASLPWQIFSPARILNGEGQGTVTIDESETKRK